MVVVEQAAYEEEMGNGKDTNTHMEDIDGQQLQQLLQLQQLNEMLLLQHM